MEADEAKSKLGSFIIRKTAQKTLEHQKPSGAKHPIRVKKA